MPFSVVVDAISDALRPIAVVGALTEADPACQSGWRCSFRPQKFVPCPCQPRCATCTLADNHRFFEAIEPLGMVGIAVDGVNGDFSLRSAFSAYASIGESMPDATAMAASNG